MGVHRAGAGAGRPPSRKRRAPRGRDRGGHGSDSGWIRHRRPSRSPTRSILRRVRDSGVGCRARRRGGGGSPCRGGRRNGRWFPGAGDGILRRLVRRYRGRRARELHARAAPSAAPGRGRDVAMRRRLQSERAGDQPPSGNRCNDRLQRHAAPGIATGNLTPLKAAGHCAQTHHDLLPAFRRPRSGSRPRRECVFPRCPSPGRARSSRRRERDGET